MCTGVVGGAAGAGAGAGAELRAGAGFEAAGAAALSLAAAAALGTLITAGLPPMHFTLLRMWYAVDSFIGFFANFATAASTPSNAICVVKQTQMRYSTSTYTLTVIGVGAANL